jgi:hypothetical protein
MIGVNELLFLICGITLVSGLMVFLYSISKNWWGSHENVWRKRYNSAVRQSLRKQNDKRSGGK